MKANKAYPGTAAAWVEISFGTNRSLAYREAMDLCRDLPAFTTTGEGDQVVHTLALPLTEIAVLLRLCELVGRWSSFRITIDGVEAGRDDLVRLGGECYARRQASQDPEQYCFGMSRLEYNLWGCRRLDMPIDESGRGWMAYGSLDSLGRWHFDKARIRQELEDAMPACRLCPVFDRARVHETLKGLPETVDPGRDSAWQYRRGVGSGGGLVNSGIAPVTARLPQYVVGGYKPNWDFTRDWRDAKTEVYLGPVDRWAPDVAAAGASKTVAIDMEEVLKARAVVVARPKAEIPKARPPARWTWVVALALVVIGLWAVLV
jgi:hypothetical protein